MYLVLTASVTKQLFHSCTSHAHYTIAYKEGGTTLWPLLNRKHRFRSSTIFYILFFLRLLSSNNQDFSLSLLLKEGGLLTQQHTDDGEGKSSHVSSSAVWSNAQHSGKWQCWVCQSGPHSSGLCPSSSCRCFLNTQEMCHGQIWPDKDNNISINAHWSMRNGDPSHGTIKTTIQIIHVCVLKTGEIKSRGVQYSVWNNNSGDKEFRSSTEFRKSSIANVVLNFRTPYTRFIQSKCYCIIIFFIIFMYTKQFCYYF